VTTPPRGLSREQVSAGVRERLTRLQTAVRPEVPPDRWAYRKAAALLTRFDPATLKPLGQAERQRALLHLLDDCVSIGDPARGEWTLKPEVRTATLRELHGRNDALRALGANPRRAGEGVERAVQEYLRGIAAPLEAQSPKQLRQSLQAVRWLAEVPGVDGIPTPDDVAAVHRRKQLFEPLHALVGDAFRGRDADLAELHRQVGFLRPSTMATVVMSAVREGSAADGRSRPPLMVFGPPGIGKSTLVAKFVLDHAGASDRRVPFVYADFERPTLSIVEPMTVLAEAARQLGTQYPAALGRLDALAERAEAETERQRAEQLEAEELGEVSATRSTIQLSVARQLRTERAERERALLYELVDALRDALKGEPPILVVLDSFERAQYRGSAHLARMWDTLAVLQQACPRVRVVVAGRAPVDDLSIGGMQAVYHRISELDSDARIGLLQAYGVEDAAVAGILAEHFGGNPLSLKLAATVARQAGWDTRWLTDIPTRRLGILRITDLQIQARLYDRLLGSLQDADVARLARAGLVLRRITPEIIREVLAEPCGVEVADETRANALFTAFAEHVDLVQPEDDGAVSHRPDVRRDMLPLVEESNPKTVEAIEQGAVAYHARQDTLVSRAEEIYHRLRLGEAPRSVDARWQPGVERYLAWAQAEVPARAQTYLAAKLAGGRVPPDVLAAADLEEWEILTAREVEELLARSAEHETLRANAALAIELMQARTDWSAGSRLYRLRAEALAVLEGPEPAERAVEDGISSIRDLRAPSTAATWESLLDLLTLGARFLHERGEDTRADLQLAEAERIAARLDRPLDALGAQLIRVRLQHAGAEVSEDPQAVRKRACRRFMALDDPTLRENPSVVRSVAQELGGEDGDVLVRAIDLLGIAPTEARDVDELVAHVERLAAADTAFAAWLEDYASRRGMRPGDADGVRDLLVRLAKTGRLGELARVLVAQSEPDNETRRLLIAMLPASTSGLDHFP
jgi:cellulose synthase operon protein C